jgi:DNA-binding IclR family transcriptional regulator
MSPRPGVTAEDVLATLSAFDRFGGASLELIAWEFGVAPSTIADVWARLRDAGLLRRAGEDPATGEPMYRLSADGWVALGGGPSGSGR